MRTRVVLLLAAWWSVTLGRADVLFDTTNTTWRFLKGRVEASTPDATAWRLPEFNDAAWSVGPAPFYYTGTPTEPPFYHGGPVSGTVLGDMINNYTCVFLRKTFTIPQAAALGSVTVRVAGDDGFIAWLNGVEVGRANMPAGSVAFDGRALGSIAEPAPIHEFTLGGGALRNGLNVLAVQGFNWDPASGDFGIMAGLATSRDVTPPVVVGLDPPDGATVGELTSLAVVFSEPVTGVDTADLRVNGNATASVNAATGTEFSFAFPSPGTGVVTVAWAAGHGITDTAGNPFAGGGWSYRLAPGGVTTPVISEFVADNDGSFLDGLGAASDWIELYNPSTLAVNLAGWRLRDGTNLWTFPATPLPAGGYLVVFASGTLLQPFTDPAGYLHTDFKLDADGEPLALLRPDGSVAWQYAAPGPQREGVSFGLPQTVTMLSTFETPARLLVPSVPLPDAWRGGAAFDDSAWLAGQASAGYGASFGGTGGTVAYRVATGTEGNQDYGGSLGMDFVVNRPIIVTELGCFDDGGNGLSLSITVQLWRRNDAGTPGTPGDDTGAAVLVANTFTPGSPGTLLEGSRFKPLAAPLTLAPGAYTILAWGYGSGERNGNLGIPTSEPWETQSGDGALSFVGSARAGSAGVFPLGVDGGPANRYAAGTFKFAGADDPLPRTSLQAAMQNVNASALMRARFNAANVGTYEALILRLAFDDGCAVWLNGTEAARRNTPALLAHNSAAPMASNAVQSLPLSARLLVSGTNLLAIHGLNISASDVDFFVGAALAAIRTDTGSPRYFAAPSPGGPNPPTGVVGYVADTKFSVKRGFYDAPFDLAITNATPGAIIRYTLDGSVPTETVGITYTAPLRIASTAVVRAFAYKPGFQPANVDTHSYLFAADVAAQPSTAPPGYPSAWTDYTDGNGMFSADYGMINPATQPANYARAAGNAAFTVAQARAALSNSVKALPVISITTDKANLFDAATGMYLHPAARGEAWERPVSVECISTNDVENWHAAAGMHIMGLTSRYLRVTPKLSFMLVFSAQFGNNWLTEPFFGADGPSRIKRIALRSNARDGWTSEYFGFGAGTYIRDGWAKDAFLASGEPGTRHRYCHVFLNGLYWGLYNPTERPEEHWAETTFGGEDEDYDVINLCCGNRLDAGDVTEWQQLLNAARAGFATDSAYQAVQGNNPDGTRNLALRRLLGVDSFIGFAVNGYYHASVDWPGNFFVVFDNSPAERTAGWRFVTWDTDLGLPNFDANENKVTPPEGFAHPWWQTSPGEVDAGLRQNAEYRMRLADRVYREFFHRGAYVTATNLARWQRLRDLVRPGLYAESARWGDYQAGGLRTVQDHWLPRVNGVAVTFFNGRNAQVLAQLRAAGLYPSLNPPEFNQRGGGVPAGFQAALTNPNAGGAVYFTVDGSDPRRPGGAIAGTALLYATPVTLTSPTLIRARVKSGTTWSALNEAQFYPPQDFTKLQLSELMYNPPRLGDVDGDEFEFLELRNTGAVPLELTGVRFTDGIHFAFPNETVLGPGQYFVLARNAAQFAVRHPGITVHGLYTGKLENNGEGLALSTALGEILFALAYDNAAPWPAEADNSGLSLQRMSFTLGVTNSVSWLAALPTPGRPLPPELVDSDADGLPDGWEATHGVSDATADADLDGLTNFQEFLAGTNPRDEDDRLRLEIYRADSSPAGLSVVLGFTARSNKTYSIAYRQSAGGAGWTNWTRFSAAPAQRTVSVTNLLAPGAASRFFRLVTPRLP